MRSGGKCDSGWNASSIGPAVSIPSIRFHALSRPRLGLAALFPGAQLPPLTLLSAPSGFGKSTLVAQWVESGELPESIVRWVRIPRSAAVYTDVWGVLARALEPDTADEPGMSTSNGQSHDLVRRRVRALSTSTVLVIDDFQFVTNAQLDLDLVELLESNELLHLIVLSHRFSVLDGPLVTSRIPVRILTQGDLAFTPDEVTEIAGINEVHSLDSARKLELMSSGWPVGTASVVQQLAGGAGPRELASLVTRFSHEHLELITASGGKRALCGIALCDGLRAELVQELIGETTENTELALRELTELGLVTRAWYADTMRYTCHSGLAGALGLRAIRELGADGVHRLRHAHAIDLGDVSPLTSVQELVELGEYDAASRMLLAHFSDLVGPEPELLPTLRSVPTDLVAQFPALTSARLVLELAEPNAAPERIRWLVEQLLAGEHEHSVEDEFGIALLALQSIGERVRGNDALALRLARDAARQLAALSPRSRTNLQPLLPEALEAVGVTALFCGDFAFAERSFGSIAKLADRLDDHGARVRGANLQALAATLQGDVPKAGAALAAGDLARAHSATNVPASSWRYEVTARLFVAGAYDDEPAWSAALEQLQPMLKHAEHWPVLVKLEALWVRARQGSAAALELVKQRSALLANGLPATTYMRGLLTTHEAELTMTIGDYRAAELLLEALPAGYPGADVSRSRLMLFRAETGALNAALACEADGLTPTQRAELACITAMAYWQAGDAEAAVSRANTAAGRLVELNSPWPLSMLPYDSLNQMVKAHGAELPPGCVEQVRAMPALERSVQYDALSPAELRTLRELQSGGTLAQVAETLFLSLNTVKFHVRHIYRKLGVTGRAEALERAGRMGMLG